jgi:hypothetical protein
MLLIGSLAAYTLAAAAQGDRLPSPRPVSSGQSEILDQLARSGDLAAAGPGDGSASKPVPVLSVAIHDCRVEFKTGVLATGFTMRMADLRQGVSVDPGATRNEVRITDRDDRSNDVTLHAGHSGEAVYQGLVAIQKSCGKSPPIF